MLNGIWRIIAALVGLTLLAAAAPALGITSAGEPSLPIVQELGERPAPNQLCEGGESDRTSDLCAQWKAADAAKESADWARRTFWHDVFGSVVGMLTLIVASAAAYYAREAARHTQAGATEAQRSATAAVRSVEVSEDTAKKQLRAYLCVEESVFLQEETLKFFSVQIIVKNYGQTPAYAVCIRAKAKTIGEMKLDSFDRSVEIDNSTEPTILGPGGRCAKSIKTILEDEELNEILIGTCHAMIVGTIHYIDIYQKPQFVEFCQRVRYYGTLNQRIHPHFFGNSAT